MEEYSKSLALQYDYFINNALKFLDTSTERGKLSLISNYCTH